MKLPIYLNVEGDSIWTEYKAELAKVQTPVELNEFVNSWRDIYSIEIKEVTQETLDCIKTEKIDDTIAELICPVKIFKAMLLAKEYIVPLNCAFIQANGGLGEFWNESY